MEVRNPNAHAHTPVTQLSIRVGYRVSELIRHKYGLARVRQLIDLEASGTRKALNRSAHSLAHATDSILELGLGATSTGTSVDVMLPVFDSCGGRVWHMVEATFCAGAMDHLHATNPVRDEKDKAQTRRPLLVYCQLNTLAMVAILEKLSGKAIQIHQDN